MIGDSIDVDILGAVNAGIDQVHVNHLNKEIELVKGEKPTYTVFSLRELGKDFLICNSPKEANNCNNITSLPIPESRSSEFSIFNFQLSITR